MTSIGTQDVVKIDRYPEGKDEPVRSQYPVRDIDRVLLENTLMDADERCSAIYLGLKSGGGSSSTPTAAWTSGPRRRRSGTASASRSTW